MERVKTKLLGIMVAALAVMAILPAAAFADPYVTVHWDGYYDEPQGIYVYPKEAQVDLQTISHTVHDDNYLGYNFAKMTNPLSWQVSSVETYVYLSDVFTYATSGGETADTAWRAGAHMIIATTDKPFVPATNTAYDKYIASPEAWTWQNLYNTSTNYFYKSVVYNTALDDSTVWGNASSRTEVEPILALDWATGLLTETSGNADAVRQTLAPTAIKTPRLFYGLPGVSSTMNANVYGQRFPYTITDIYLYGNN